MIKELLKNSSHPAFNKVIRVTSLFTYDAIDLMLFVEAEVNNKTVNYLLNLAEETDDMLLWLAFELPKGIKAQSAADHISSTLFREHTVGLKTLFTVELNSEGLRIATISYEEAYVKLFFPAAW